MIGLDKYINYVTSKLVISKEDLTEVEMSIINIGYELWSEKCEDIKLLQDQNHSISIENKNLKSYHDDSGYYAE